MGNPLLVERIKTRNYKLNTDKKMDQSHTFLTDDFLLEGGILFLVILSFIMIPFLPLAFSEKVSGVEIYSLGCSYFF